MGRPSNGKPYLKNGTYHVRFKGDKGPDTATDLGTKSLSVAASRVKEVVRMRERNGQPSNPPAISTIQPVPGSDSGNKPVSTDSQGPLDDWYKGDSVFTPTESRGFADLPTKPTFEDASPVFGPALPTPSLPNNGTLAKIDWEATPGVAGLSADEKLRLHGLLGSVVGRVNVLAIGMGVRIFGRIPAEPEEADLELLNKAWEMQLKEWLADTEIKPAVLIAAASIGLGVSMYANGEPKPPKVPVESKNV